ncbi:hypothetical protein BE17_00605 [Sorangium cellulosum]|uniref:Secreted protein n=1 Tax=Sorangium cellulosum TaxID=56 RepID=A0A150RFM7_SORCE|nr:hypothetical protein BE17_00605 [Sorangium cellulosum]
MEVMRSRLVIPLVFMVSSAIACAGGEPRPVQTAASISAAGRPARIGGRAQQSLAWPPTDAHSFVMMLVATYRRALGREAEMLDTIRGHCEPADR